MTTFVQATFTGTIGRIDTEVKHAPSNAAYITASIPENYTQNGVEYTRWHNITFWQGQAEFAHRNFAKGTLITTTCQIIPGKEGRCSFWVQSFTPLANFGAKYVASTTAPSPNKKGTTKTKTTGKTKVA